jgi:hypothetical protein
VIQHIYPINETERHVLEGYSCPCNPKIDWENELVIHRAFDHREVVEEANEILNGIDDEA